MFLAAISVCVWCPMHCVCVLVILQQVMDASEQDAQACRQEENLLKELEKMTKIRSASGYKIKAPRHVQDAHLLKVRSVNCLP